MRKDKRNKKAATRNVPMTLACVLFCLTLFSIHFTSDLYARYITSDSASDGARVVKFGTLRISEEGDFSKGKAIFIPGVNLEKKVTVEYTGGETDVYVFVAMDAPGWAAADSGNKSFADRYCSKMIWTVDADWNWQPTADGRYIYWQYVDSNETFTDDFIADDGRIIVSEDITKTQIKSMTDIEINLRAYVVQANGFANAADAWASLAEK